MEWGNPSSVHSFGRAARRIVEDARRQVAALAGADPATVVFTSGGTEANNLALRGCGRTRILVSAVEHPSVLEAADDIETIPWMPTALSISTRLRAMLRDGEGTVVSVMLANNETGVDPAGTQAAAMAHEAGALFHCDAVQGAGKLPLDFQALGVDMMTLSAHKIGGPKGAGALFVADHVQLPRSSAAAARSAAGGTAPRTSPASPASARRRNWHRRRSVRGSLATLRDRLETTVLAEIPGARIVAGQAERLPNTSCIALPGISAETQIMALDLAGFAVSAGSACSSGKVKASRVLRAMGLGERHCRLRHPRQPRPRQQRSRHRRVRRRLP